MSGVPHIKSRFDYYVKKTGSESTAALLVLAEAVDGVSGSLGRLGNADASTPLGGLEGLGLALQEGANKMADSLQDLANNVLSLTTRK
jgi:hypothetical protein